MPYKKRVYEHFDFIDPCGRECKYHRGSEGLILGYHGNEGHYEDNFFPDIAKALSRLADNFDFKLKVVIKNPETKPRISRVKSVFVPWQLDTYEDEIASFDIGLCPAIGCIDELNEWHNLVRNPNRVISLLSHGIPSVTSPIPESLQILTQGENTLFAVTEEGWYQAIRKLIENPEFRNRLGKNGFELVNRKFTTDTAADAYLDILRKEIESPVCTKDTGKLDIKRSVFKWDFINPIRRKMGI